MKFTVSQAALLRALSVVSKGMGTNATLPLLSGIYIRAAEGCLEFQTNNLVISVRHLIPANVEEPGETVVSGKVISNIAKTLADAAVSFEGEERLVTLSCEKSTFRLNTLPAADWSGFPEIAPEKTVELPSALLAEMVERVYRVTSKETSRPILQGVLLTVEDNTIRLVATDSFRLAVCDSSVEGPKDGAFRAIVSGSVLHDVLSMPSMTETIQIGVTDSQVVFSFGTTTFVCRRIEGNFPDYKQLLPSTCSTAMNLSVDSFSAALRRVSTVAQQNSAVRIDVDAEGSTIRLFASSPDQGESSEIIPVDVEGQSLAIALNHHYVLDCMSAVAGSGEVRFELQGPTQPCVFKTNAKVNYLYLLMPVRL